MFLFFILVFECSRANHGAAFVLFLYPSFYRHEGQSCTNLGVAFLFYKALRINV